MSMSAAVVPVQVITSGAVIGEAARPCASARGRRRRPARAGRSAPSPAERRATAEASSRARASVAPTSGGGREVARQVEQQHGCRALRRRSATRAAVGQRDRRHAADAAAISSGNDDVGRDRLTPAPRQPFDQRLRAARLRARNAPRHACASRDRGCHRRLRSRRAVIVKPRPILRPKRPAARQLPAGSRFGA